MKDNPENRDRILRIVGECAMPGLITLLIFGGVLFSKGIWPFGNNLIDYYDMGQTNAPLYFHLRDFLLGRSALFFDWYINLGQNLSMGSAIQWNISPFNLFFLLVPEKLLYPSLSVFMGLHLFFMAFNMGLFLKKLPLRLSGSFSLAAATAYGLCGYTLTHYTIPTYLDMAVFFPLLALSLMRLLKGRGVTPYILMLSFTTALSYYLSFMNLIYILLFSGVYIFLIIEDEGKRKKAAFDLFAGTIGGIALSSFMLIPSVLQMTASSRFNSNLSGGPVSTLVSILNSIGADQYYVKFFQLYALELFIMVILAGAAAYRKEPKYTAALLLTAFIPCALIPFESINILMHFGTYYHYPIRCAYMIPFSLVAVASCFYSKMDSGKRGEQSLKSRAASYIAACALLILMLGIYLSRKEWEIRELFKVWAVFSLILFLVMVLIPALHMIIGKYDIKRAAVLSVRLLIPLIFAEFIAGAYAGYGLPRFKDKFFSDPEQSGEYITKSQAFISAAGEVFDEGDPAYRLRRMKNPDTDLNANYGMVIRHATLAGWANTATGEAIKSAEKLGYSTHFMRILDSGGTFLSDSVFGIRDIVSERDISAATEGTYSLKGTYETDEGKFYLYENSLSLPFVLTADDDILSWRFSDNNIAENNNALYSALSGDEGRIAELLKVSELDGMAESGSLKKISLSISGRKAVYLIGGKADAIQVDGKPVPVSTIGDLDNTEYPAWFNSSLILLGTFSDEEVEISCPEKSRLILFDLEKMEALSKELNRRFASEGEMECSAGKADLSFTVKGEGSRKTALIPLSYSKGWKAAVNGKPAAPADFNGLFMTLPLEEGENYVNLKFTPPGLISGLIISGLMLALLLSRVYIKQLSVLSGKISESLQSLIYPVFCFVFLTVTLALYVIPIAWFFVHEVLKRIL